MSDKPETKAPETKAVHKSEKTEQAKGPKKVGDTKPHENKEGERRQPNRNYRQNYGGPKYPKKSGENDNEETKEETKKEGLDNNENKGEKQERKKKQFRERIMVTLETVIPELPKKSEKLSEPDTKVYDAEYERMQKEIDAIYVKMVKLIINHIFLIIYLERYG